MRITCSASIAHRWESSSFRPGKTARHPPPRDPHLTPGRQAMRKVKLDVEQLAVESFETSASHGQGTVLGRMPDLDVRPFAGAGKFDTYPDCPSPLCQDTPLASCDGSCRPGCDPNNTIVKTA
jgi:hypothetical protein